MSEFDKIIGYEDAKLELKRFCDVLKNPRKYEKLGVTMPSGILLYGRPGVGKTMMAKCFIAESGHKVFTLRKEKPDGDFVKEIKEVFEKAKAEAPAIVFLDDMDKYANEDRLHRDAEEYVSVQSCIDNCKGCNVFTIATVNHRFDLPDSLLRVGRFDKLIEMGIPKGKDAEKIIEFYLKSKSTVGDIDLEETARLLEQHTCAELESVVNEAGIYAGFDGRDKITQKDLIKACMRMIFDAPECIDISDTVLTRKMALHEAGHAVVAEILEPGSVSLVSICKYDGPAGGITKYKLSDAYDYSKELQEYAVMRGLGGKAATELVYGETDTGCTADLSEAYNIVSDFVDDHCAYGFDAFVRENSSGYLLEKKDRMMAVEMDRYYARTKKILTENRTFLEKMTNDLMDKKTLTYRDIQKIKADIGIAA